jgi:acetyl-CoA carboxylase carboxyltransferase component
MASSQAPASSLLRPLVEDLERRREQIRLGGGEAKVAKQHAEEKLTARERLALRAMVMTD